MLIVSIYKNGFTVKGHADYDEKGKDIVCAGVSTLAQSVLVSILNRQFPHNRIRHYTRPGDMMMSAQHSNGQIRAMIDVLKTGAIMIADQYPEHVVVEIIKERIT